MLKKRKNNVSKNLFLLFISDIFIVVFSLFLSIIFRFEFKIPDSLVNYLTISNIIIIISIKIISFRIFGLYKGMWRYTSIWDMFNIIKANIGANSFAVVLIAYTYGFANISRSLFMIDLIVCTCLISTSRLGIRVFFSHIVRIIRNQDGKDLKRRIILVGAGNTGQSILRQVSQDLNNSIRIVGFFDDDQNKIGRSINGIEILGEVSQLSSHSDMFDEVYICVPSATRKQMRSIVEECKKTGKSFKTLPSLSELMEGKVSISQFREVSVTDLLGRKEILLEKTSIVNFLKGKRILVTGAGGSIGSELVRQCAKYNPSVIVLIDFSELNLFEIERELFKQKSNILLKPILSDIRDYSSINSIFKEYKPQVVFHAAAYKHVPMQESFPLQAVNTNIFGTINLSEISIKYDVEKFVLVSTDKAVKPTNVMGATKRLAEIVIQSSNSKSSKTDFMAVRFGNVLGSSGSVIPIFRDQIKNGGPITITDPDMERYFMSIPEASQLILQAGSLGEGGEIFILDMGKTIKIIDLATDLIKLSGFDPEDIPIKITGTRPGEKKIEELVLPTEKLDGTKHEKIFVLNDESSIEDIEIIINKIRSIKEKSVNKNPSEIKSILASILTDYEPKHFGNIEDEKFFNKKNPKVEA